MLQLELKIQWNESELKMYIMIVGVSRGVVVNYIKR